MKFTPKTDKEINEAGLIPEGIYPFETVKAKDEISSKGNEMITIKNAIYVNGALRGFVFDYLLEAMAFKLAHYCNYTGLNQKYQSGELQAMDCVGRTGYAKIAIDPEKNGYAAKNVIKDYVEKQFDGVIPIDDDNDIPF